jgi:ketosteroid isomerase-like protein
MVMSDLLALRALVDRYAAAVDERDESTLVGLFTPDAQVVLPTQLTQGRLAPELCGRLQIASIVEGVRSFGRTRHDVIGQVVHVDGNRATGRTECVAHHIFGRPPRLRDLVLELHYVDEFVRAADAWLIRRRELVLDRSTTDDVPDVG